MKATELMIGDFVEVKNYGAKEVIGIKDFDGVIEISENEDSEVDIPYDYVSPIPLTTEVLEKNGWKEAQFWHEYKDGENILQSCLPDMRGIINGVEIQHFNCEYVHQYQHLLRLCCLNELADNFII